MRSPIPTTASSRENRRRNSSRGATMVEFAIVSVWLFTLIFGIIEGGFAVRARSSVNNAVDDAARRGAVAGTSSDADYQIIRQLVGRDAQAAKIDYVVVFNAVGGNPEVPTGCIDGVQQTDVCNVFRPDATTGEFDLNPASYGCGGGLGTQWCPIDRTAPEDGIAFIGVFVKADYEPILNQLFFEFSFEVNAVAIQALETTGTS